MTVDVLVIGGGQAGLATAYWLERSGLSIRVIDAGERIGDRWRKRYSSLALFTPREFSSLPGLELSGDPGGYASAAEFGDYLERYAEKFGLPVTSGVRVVKLTKRSDRFLADLSNGESVQARKVVIATGGFQTPVVPAMASGLSAEVRQFTAESYYEPSDVVAGRPVLVVGDGASGRDIAADLVATHRVVLACGRPRRLLPERFLASAHGSGSGRSACCQRMRTRQSDVSCDEPTHSPIGSATWTICADWMSRSGREQYWPLETQWPSPMARRPELAPSSGHWAIATRDPGSKFLVRSEQMEISSTPAAARP